MKHAVLLAVGFAALADAQGQTWIGNRAGIGLYRQRIESDKVLPTSFTEGWTTLAAPTIKLPIDIRFSRHFGMIIEPGFVQRGSKFHKWSGYVSTTRVNSVELAVLAKGAMEFGKWTPYVLAGPSLTRQLTVRVAYTTTNGHDDEGTITVDDISVYKPAYMSVFAGAGIAFSIGAPRLFLDYRAMWGLSPGQGGDLVDINGNVLGEIEIFDQGHIISIGWSIPLSREAWRATPVREAPTTPEQ